MKRARVVAMLWPAALAALVLTGPAAADTGKADAACKRGDYDCRAVYWYREAYDNFRKAAEQGDAKAQSWLGRMYEQGRGVAGRPAQ